MAGTMSSRASICEFGSIRITILLFADYGVLAYTHPCHTQCHILLWPPCLASIPLRQLDIVAGFNIVHNLALLVVLLLLALILSAVFVIVLVDVD